MVTKFIHDENGHTSMEYIILAALLAFVIIGALTLMGGEISSKFEFVSNTLDS